MALIIWHNKGVWLRSTNILWLLTVRWPCILAPGRFILIMEAQSLNQTVFPWKDLNMVDFWTAVCKNPNEKLWNAPRCHKTQLERSCLIFTCLQNTQSSDQRKSLFFPKKKKGSAYAFTQPKHCSFPRWQAKWYWSPYTVMIRGGFSLLKCQDSLSLSKGVVTKAFIQVLEKIQSELMGERLCMNTKCYFLCSESFKRNTDMFGGKKRNLQYSFFLRLAGTWRCLYPREGYGAWVELSVWVMPQAQVPLLDTRVGLCQVLSLPATY